jgi:L-aminopeptidase/D-esterase-like protein
MSGLAGDRNVDAPPEIGGPRLAPGFRVGHWTNAAGTSGCTVVLPPAGNVASVDVRGLSPGSRELAPLEVERQRTEVHALVLAGGSAFGLAAADGVARWLEARGIGFRVGPAVVPIVPAAVILDAAVADPAARPGPEAGAAACEAAVEAPVATGRVGAGTGATVGKWAGREHGVPGGLGVASAREGDLAVGALAVVNALGDVVAADGRVLAGTRAPEPSFRTPPADPRLAWSTVLVVVATVARLDKADVHFLAARGSDGVTRAVRPAHTRYDGDVTFAVAAPPPAGGRAAGAADLDRLGVLAADAVAAAVRAAVAGPAPPS